MYNVLLSGELKFLQDRYGFSKPRYPRYAIDLSYPAIRYAIAAVMPLLFQITTHVWLLLVMQKARSASWLQVMVDLTDYCNNTVHSSASHHLVAVLSVGDGFTSAGLNLVHMNG